jgi:uncharacterized membrane protein
VRRRACTLAAALALCLVAGAPERAKAQEAEALTPWVYSLYKTISYEVLASAADGVYYAAFIDAADLAGAGLFAAASVGASAATYYAHELAWTVYGPTPEEYAASPVEVGLLKTVSYRAIATARSFALGLAFTGDPAVSAVFALAGNLYDPVIYVANEYAWTAYGPPLQR